jgi:2-iminobutanoate/2-iminopropanoate deaminase
MVVVPRLPGPIRAELTFTATRPSPDGRDFGSVTSSDGSAFGVRRGSTVYVDALTAPGDTVDAQARAAFSRLRALVQQGGLDWTDVALVTLYLSDIADMPRVEAIFAETFPKDPPARVAIQVQPQAAERVRIVAIAAR